MILHLKQDSEEEKVYLRDMTAYELCNIIFFSLKVIPPQISKYHICVILSCPSNARKKLKDQ